MGNKFSDNLQVVRAVMVLKVVTAVALPVRVAMVVKAASGTLSKVGTRKGVTSKGVISKQASRKEVTQQPTAAAAAIDVPPAVSSEFITSRL
jgi:hypothetical protein